MHKDAPDNSICEDCMKEAIKKVVFEYFEELKGGLKNGRNNK